MRITSAVLRWAAAAGVIRAAIRVEGRSQHVSAKGEANTPDVNVA